MADCQNAKNIFSTTVKHSEIESDFTVCTAITQSSTLTTNYHCCIVLNTLIDTLSSFSPPTHTQQIT